MAPIVAKSTDASDVPLVIQPPQLRRAIKIKTGAFKRARMMLGSMAENSASAAENQTDNISQEDSEAEESEAEETIEIDEDDAQTAIDTLSEEYEKTITEQYATISALYAQVENLREENISLKLLVADNALMYLRKESNTQPQSANADAAYMSQYPALNSPKAKNSWQEHATMKTTVIKAVKKPTIFATRPGPKKTEVKIPAVDIHTVLISPRLETTTRTTDAQVKSFVNLLATDLRKKGSLIKPLKVRAINNGGLAIDLPSKNDQDDIVKLLDTTSAGDGFRARAVLKLNPRLRIEGIRNEFIPDNIVQSLAENNTDIFGSSPSDEELRHITTTTNIRSRTSTIIIEVSPAVRAKIMKKKSVKLDMTEGTVSDNLYIRQCRKCFAFGHLKSNCPDKNKKACGSCGGEHLTVDCQTKNTLAGEKTCVICKFHPIFSSSANTHGASESSKCPSYRAVVRKVQNNIQYV